ncbi:MAG: type IV pilus assembly protein PilM, partial [Planctomycetota bacterium]
MPVQPGVWGIDLGQCALKALRVENIDGQVTATAFDYVEHPKILSQPDADPDQLTREALEKFLSRNSLKGDLVAISIPGQSGLARFVKLPPVEEKKIGDIVRFEAKQQIPFNLEEVVWDFQKLNTGVVTDGFAMETEIGLFAIKRETVNRYLQHFKDVNVEVHIVQMAPLALCNFVSYDLIEKAGENPAEGPEPGGRKKCVVALDIGADNSNLVITDGARIIWQRPIPLGGNHFTRALTKDMKLTFAKAEHLKRNATKSPELKQILSSLKPVLNDFVGEVQRSLGYFTNTHRDATVQYMMGLGSAFRLPGLQKFLSEKLQLDVRKLQKLERLTGDEVVAAPVYTDNLLSFAVAYGLALQGLKVARLHTNLLPQEIRVERMIRGKKPWAAAAAAAMLFGTSMLAVGYNREYVAVASEPVKKQMEGAKRVAAEASDWNNKVEGVKKQIEQHKEAVRSIIAGQDERLNWIQFNQFINRALPKPDLSNLNKEKTPPDGRSAVELFANYNAKQAYKRLLAEQRGTAEAKDKIDEDWLDDLVQVNVESIFCVWSSNLADFHSKLKGEREAFARMSAKDQQTPPEGKGWVVEIRGYTYHDNGFVFVNKAVVENLARFPIIVRPEPAADGPAPAGTQPAGDAAKAPADASATQPGKDGGKDAAKAPPAPAPASGNQANPTASTGGTDSGDKSKEGANTNQVSHVVLYQYWTETNPDPANFHLINSRHVDAVTGGGGATGGMSGMSGAMPGAPMGGQGGEFRKGMGGGGGGGGSGSWSPLGTDGAGGGGGGRPGGSGRLGGEGRTGEAGPGGMMQG